MTPAAIVERRDELQNVEIQVTAPTSDPGWFLTDMSDSFKLVIEKYLHIVARPAHDEKRVDFLPFTTATWWKAYRDGRTDSRDIDVFITQASPPDKRGFCSFGANLWERKNYARAARSLLSWL